MRFNNPFEAIEAEVDMALPPTVNQALPHQVLQRLNMLFQPGSLGLVVILRGVPGIGKSTLAKKIRTWCLENDMTCVICNADIWMMRANGYNWDPNQLVHAHNHCKGRFVLAMAAETDVIVIDNTNLHRAHYEWYVNHLDVENYEVQCIEIDCQNLDAARLASARSHVRLRNNRNNNDDTETRQRNITRTLYDRFEADRDVQHPRD